MANKTIKKDMEAAHIKNKGSVPTSTVGVSMSKSATAPMDVSNSFSGPIVSDAFDTSNTGQTGYLRGFNGKYVSSENGGQPMTCNRTTPLDWEKFMVVHNVENVYRFMGSNNQFVTRGDNDRLFCNTTQSSTYIDFWITNNSDGTISLQGSNEKYVSVLADGTMACNASNITGQECFTWVTEQEMQVIRNSSGQVSTSAPATSTTPGATSTGSSPVQAAPTAATGITQQSMTGTGGKYWWLWYLLAAVAIILYLKFRK